MLFRVIKKIKEKYKREIYSSIILVALGMLFLWIHIVTGIHLQIWLFPLLMFIVYHYFNVWRFKPRLAFGSIVILLLYILGNYMYTHSIYYAESHWIKIKVEDEEYFIRLEPFSYSKVYTFTVWVNGSKNESVTLNLYKYDGRLYKIYRIDPQHEKNKTYYRLDIAADSLEKGIYYFNYSFMRDSNDYRIRHSSYPGPIHMSLIELYAFISQSMIIPYTLLSIIYLLLIVAIHITREGGKRENE